MMYSMQMFIVIEPLMLTQNKKDDESDDAVDDWDAVSLDDIVDKMKDNKDI